MIHNLHNICLLFLILAAFGLNDWLGEPEENFKSRRSLRKSWQGLGRLSESLLGSREVWAGQYQPNRAVSWVPNTLEEFSVGDVDLCGHSCSEGVQLFGFSVCQVTWEVGCSDTEPPEGVNPDTSLYDLCPKECDTADPSKQGDAGQAEGDVLDHIKVWTAADGKHYEKSNVRIELMPQPNPNTQPKKPKRDHTCVCTGCPKPEKKEIKVDPEKLARAKGKSPVEEKEETEKERVEKLDKELDGDKPEVAVGDDFEWVLSGTEEEANKGKAADATQPKGADKEEKQLTCPQCCLDAFKSDWNHVIFHDLNENKQDEPETESGVALMSSYPNDSEEH